MTHGEEKALELIASQSHLSTYQKGFDAGNVDGFVAGFMDGYKAYNDEDFEKAYKSGWYCGKAEGYQERIREASEADLEIYGFESTLSSETELNKALNKRAGYLQDLLVRIGAAEYLKPGNPPLHNRIRITDGELRAAWQASGSRRE